MTAACPALEAAGLIRCRDLGDEAFLSSTDADVRLAARRANVTVSIDVDLDLRLRQEAETAARALTAAILADVRPQ